MRPFAQGPQEFMPRIIFQGKGNVYLDLGPIASNVGLIDFSNLIALRQ
jgi:hypothetical protein